MMQKKRSRIITVIGILVVLAILITGGTVVSRYIKQSANENKVGASGFYFTSDYLNPAADNSEYSVSTSSVTIKLMNSSDSLHITDSNISYAVEVENGTASASSGTINGGAENSVSITVTPTDPTETVVVTATASAPYVKAITAKFNFDEFNGGATYLIEDAENSDYATLKIMAGEQSISANSVQLTWNTSKASLDPTCEYLIGNSDINSGSLTIADAIPAHQTAVIYIFKKDITENYTTAETALDGTIAIA